jgi:hypothetical protein
VVGSSGERLAKRDRALSLDALRSRNVDPVRIVGELLRLSGQSGDSGQGLAERAPSFDLARVPKAPLALPDLRW